MLKRFKNNKKAILVMQNVKCLYEKVLLDWIRYEQLQGSEITKFS